MKLRLLLPLFAFTAVAHADLSDDARKATDTYEKECSRLKLAYAQKLDQLLANAKTAGDAAAVKTIEGMIAQVEGKAPATKNAAFPTGDETSHWAWGSGGELTLQGNGKAKHSAWSKSGTWKRGANETLIVISDTGVAFEIKFDANGIGKVRSIAGGDSTTIVPKN